MAEIQYSISELHNLFELELRGSMSLNKNADMHEVAVENKDSILAKGNPVKNHLYKNMKLNTMLKHINEASSVKTSHVLDTDAYQDADYIIDDGQITALGHMSAGHFYHREHTTLSPYKPHSKLNLYQPYFKPTGRISDFAVAHSVGTVGLKFERKARQSTNISYVDKYGDKDINCVTVVIDIGRDSTIDINESFENKDGIKIYKIVYLIRDHATLILNREHDLKFKDRGINVIETNVIQFPYSKFEYNVTGEGCKHNQDLMYIDVHDFCDTKVNGRYDLYGDYTNNSAVNVHHIGTNSTSRVDVKSIVDDNSHSSFLGCITVDKNAIDTDAELVNKNLLVSNTATAITEPQLDIHTKEIACSHGCTVSNIDENQLYFLQSRGIETNMAEETLKQCFLTE